MTSRLSFEHFDPDVEIGIVDEQGTQIRPRKKPGRKPNPPTPAQRKAQNRAAQRAFRERKRQEMQNAEAMVRHCILQRDQALQEVNMLRLKVQELQFENNYLKGCTLALKLACFANRVEVPNLWNIRNTDTLGTEELAYSKTNGIPQSLEIFLDRHKHIVGLNDDQSISEDINILAQCSPPSAVADMYPAGENDGNVFSQPSSNALNNQYSHNQNIALTEPIGSMASSVTETGTVPPTTVDLASITPQLVNQLDSPFFKNISGVALATLIPDHFSVPIEKHKAEPLILCNPSLQESSWLQDPLPEKTHSAQVPSTSLDLDIDMTAYLNDPATDFNSDDVLLPQEEPQQDTAENLAPKNFFTKDNTINESVSLGPMDSFTLVRLLASLCKSSKSLFTATELQRTIPHDARIDFIPNAAMRDNLIIFQDFYSAETFFKEALESTLFMGGKINDLDSWYAPISFLEKYWFIMPNQIRKRSDNISAAMVSYCQQLIKKMLERKQMYIERERYSSHFPPAFEDDSVANKFSPTFQDVMLSDPWHVSPSSLVHTM